MSLLSRDSAVRFAYARDASGLERVPEAVARPSSVDEVVAVMRQATRDRVHVTAAGGQTSTTGGSVTDDGILLSLRGLDRIIDIDRTSRRVRVQAGANLGDVKRACAAEGLLLAPDPTSENEITVGGAIACNASGARSLRYGATRPHVSALTVVLANGEIMEARRTGLEKNTVGYAMAQEPVDWFVGSEGTLGIVVEAEFALLPLPGNVVGLGIPFAREADALRFVIAARESRALSPRCLEFFDEAALEIVREWQSHEGKARWPADARAFVYTEEAGDPDREPPLDAWLALAAEHGALTDDALVFDSDAAIRDARDSRHSVPSTMIERGNAFRPQGGRRVSTDWAVPYATLADAVTEARRLAREAGVSMPVIYGHAGNGHPHQNFVARDAAELERLERVVEATLRHVISLGGTFAAEHGIGKLKRRWVPLQLAPVQVDVMRATKHALDPLGLLAPGNVFP